MDNYPRAYLTIATELDMSFSKPLAAPLAAILAFCLVAETVSAAEIQVTPATGGAPALILLTGEIQSGDSEKFSREAAANPNAVVFLDSSGGEIVPAMEIGKTIRLREYPTAVYQGSSCASACALIWLAGSRRIIYDDGKVGFHASYKSEGKRLVEVGVANALIGQYVSQLGFDARAVIFVTSAPPTSISWLTTSNAISSGISYETLHAEVASQAKKDGMPELSDLMGGGEVNARAAIDGTSKASRNVYSIATGLVSAGYKGEVDVTDPKSPKIYTGIDGNKAMLAFSSCVATDCNYLEFIAEWSGVDQDQANRTFKEFALEEEFSSIVYQKDSKNLIVYHYVIIGADGITTKTLFENLEYFNRDFEKIGKILAGNKQ
jgi:hypothetical protein